MPGRALPGRHSDDRRRTHLKALRPFLPRVLAREALVHFRPVSVCAVLCIAALDRITVDRFRVAALRMGRIIVRGLWLLPVSVQYCSCRTGRRTESSSCACPASKYRSASRFSVTRQLVRAPSHPIALTVWGPSECFLVEHRRARSKLTAFFRDALSKTLTCTPRDFLAREPASYLT